MNCMIPTTSILRQWEPPSLIFLKIVSPYCSCNCLLTSICLSPFSSICWIFIKCPISYSIILHKIILLLKGEVKQVRVVSAYEVVIHIDWTWSLTWLRIMSTVVYMPARLRCAWSYNKQVISWVYHRKHYNYLLWDVVHHCNHISSCRYIVYVSDTHIESAVLN
jgi:hypothetical protein